MAIRPKSVSTHSRGVAAVMSAIIPGLGQVYCGNFVDAIVAFLAVTIAAVLAPWLALGAAAGTGQPIFLLFAFMPLALWMIQIYRAYHAEPAR